MSSEFIERNSFGRRANAPTKSLLKKVTLIACLLTASSIYLVLEKLPGEHHLTASPYNETAPAGGPLERIKAALDARKFRNSTELVDHVMRLTNRHTVEALDDWHDQNWDKRDVVLDRLYRAMQGDDAARPHSSCGPKCMIMAWVLQAYKIPSRQVGIVSSKYARILGHQQIEVLNPDTGRWELYDPTWDVHFVDEESGRRVSALDMHFRPLKVGPEGNAAFAGVVPSNDDGSLQGWQTSYPFGKEKTVPIGNFADYGALLYYCYQTEHAMEILVNVNRFDIDKKWDYPELGLWQTSFDTYCRKVYLNHRLHFLHEQPTEALADRIEHPALMPLY